MLDSGAVAGMELGVGADKLLSQLCWEVGFPKNDGILGPYLAGTFREMLDFYPELEAYRDVAFMFKWMTCWVQASAPRADRHGGVG